MRLHTLARVVPRLTSAARRSADSPARFIPIRSLPVALLDLSRELVTRALDPFPVPLRTLDALHLASADFLRSQGVALRIATYDARLRVAATAMDFAIVELE